MRVQNALFIAVILALQSFYSSAATLYVDLNSANPTPPYANWSTAATNIQDAVDAASAGDLILVTNGVYQTGGRVYNSSLTNRVVINKAVMVQSINGPAVTIIQGNPTIGTNAVRCVYLTNNAVLVGFTLTNGATIDSTASDPTHDCYGGGAWCESTNSVLTNCVLTFNSSQNNGGGVNDGTLNNCLISFNNNEGAYGSVLNNCTINGNRGLGADGCTLNNCTITDNNGGNGGGAYGSTLNNCVISNNNAIGWIGGGANACILNNCLLFGNTAIYGGGAYYCALNNCILMNNSASWGGGAFGSTLNNCSVIGNFAHNHYFTSYAESLGGGIYGGTAINCTIVGNTVVLDENGSGTVFYTGGGASSTMLSNCIVYFNSESPLNHDTSYNYDGGTLVNCCTLPLPGGIGNFTNTPIFVNQTGGDYHLQSSSPCINSGNNMYVPVTNDLDGNPRIVGGTVDIGAYEYQTPSSILSYAWAQQYGLPTDGSVDHLDLDGTGFSIYQDWIAGLDPTNVLSVLEMLSPTATNNPSGIVVTWQSVNTRTYYLQSSTNLGMPPAFTTIQSNIVGQAGTTSYTDTTATNGGPYFYRVGVQ